MPQSLSSKHFALSWSWDGVVVHVAPTADGGGTVFDGSDGRGVPYVGGWRDGTLLKLEVWVQRPLFGKVGTRLFLWVVGLGPTVCPTCLKVQLDALLSIHQKILHLQIIHYLTTAICNHIYHASLFASGISWLYLDIAHPKY